MRTFEKSTVGSACGLKCAKAMKMEKVSQWTERGIKRTDSHNGIKDQVA